MWVFWNALIYGKGFKWNQKSNKKKRTGPEGGPVYDKPQKRSLKKWKTVLGMKGRKKIIGTGSDARCANVLEGRFVGVEQSNRCSFCFKKTGKGIRTEVPRG